MTRKVLAAAAACLLLILFTGIGPASARGYRHHHHHYSHHHHHHHHHAIAFRSGSQSAQDCMGGNDGRWRSCGFAQRMGGQGRASGYRRIVDANENRADPRPRAWCGWWMRHYLGVADRAGNLARWWAGFGRRAAGPAVGVLVVWHHHVGIITAQTKEGFVVKSGNDGHAVRERVRSVRGAIAFRWPA